MKSLRPSRVSEALRCLVSLNNGTSPYPLTHSNVHDSLQPCLENPPDGKQGKTGACDTGQWKDKEAAWEEKSRGGGSGDGLG
jgi:hypothetical protein